MLNCVGIDPGRKGALALYLLDGGVQHLEIEDMPVVTFRVSGQNRWRVDLERLATILAAYRQFTHRAVVEEQQVMPRDSRTGVFQVGVGYGQLLGCVHAAGFECNEIKAGQWKKDCGVRGKTDGDEGIMHRAQQLFPQHTETLRRVGPSGKVVRGVDRAEAAMLARWGVDVMVRKVSITC